LIRNSHSDRYKIVLKKNKKERQYVESRLLREG